jgi:hypothetical protein
MEPPLFGALVNMISSPTTLRFVMPCLLCARWNLVSLVRSMPYTKPLNALALFRVGTLDLLCILSAQDCPKDHAKTTSRAMHQMTDDRLSASIGISEADMRAAIRHTLVYDRVRRCWCKERLLLVKSVSRAVRELKKTVGRAHSRSPANRCRSATSGRTQAR